jgi:CheY-like chemotaxis protein
MKMTGSVIYVEDEPDDAFFMERAFRQCAPDVELRILTNGGEAIRFFTEDFERVQHGELAPGLVLLDLNLPGNSGLEVLREIRAQPLLKMLPVIIYTSSNQQIDIVEAYRCGCSGYLVKSRSPERLKDVVNAMAEFWIKENQYPPAAAS